jgi:hypothetical protein
VPGAKRSARSAARAPGAAELVALVDDDARPVHERQAVRHHAHTAVLVVDRAPRPQPLHRRDHYVEAADLGGGGEGVAAVGGHVVVQPQRVQVALGEHDAVPQRRLLAAAPPGAGAQCAAGVSATNAASNFNKKKVID